MPAPSTFKQNYRCVPALQQFYTGGPFVVASDGSFLACSCGDAIKIVDTSNASIRATIEGDSENITALAISPNDKFLFSAGHSRQIRVFDTETLKCVRAWKGHDGPVMSMTCDASGAYLATAGTDKKVLVWNVDGGFCTHYFKGHKAVVTCIVFHPEPKRFLLFSGSEDATVRVWDLVTKKCAAVLEKHISSVTSVEVSEDGWTLLTAGRDKVVNLWDLHNYGCKMTVLTFEVLEGVCIIHSGTPFASSLDIYRKISGRKPIGSSAIYFVTVGERGIVRIWNSEGAVCLFEQKSSDVTVNSDDSRMGFTAAVMLPADQGLLCVTADQQFLFYTQMEYNKGLLNLSKRFVGYNEQIIDMKFLGEEEKLLVVATNQEQVQVCELASMSCLYVLAGHTDLVLCLDTCVSSSGKTLIVTGSKDNNVRVWDADTRKCIGICVGHTGDVGAVAFSKKHKNFLVSGSIDRTLKVWSLSGISDDVEQPANLKSKAVVMAHDKDINSVAVAPNDSLVCSGSQDRTARVWRLPDLVSVLTLKGHKRAIWSVEFSPVDQCVVTASGDKTIKIWAISDGSCLKTFEGHNSTVFRASFVTRGTQLVSCGGDGLVKLWAVRNNECVATYDQHEDKVFSLAVGKETEMLATGGNDALVNLWYDSTASDKEEAFHKEEEEVLRSQELENAVKDADFSKAVQIAFKLRRPHKLFELFAELSRKRDAEDQMVHALCAIVREEYHLLFEYIREWNTKPKFCHVAQFVLLRVFHLLPPTEIIKIKGIGELLEGLIPYSQRHFSRIDRLVRSSLLLDYTLMGMSVFEPVSDSKKPIDETLMRLGNTDADEEDPLSSVENVEEQNGNGEEHSENRVSRKRKSSKSTGGKHKKIREAAYVKISGSSF